MVACQNERSQLRNRDTAMRILKSRLFQIYEQKQKQELADLTGEKKDIAFGSQIRTYTFAPVPDHQGPPHRGRGRQRGRGDGRRARPVHPRLSHGGADQRPGVIARGRMSHVAGAERRPRRQRADPPPAREARRAGARAGVDPFGGRFPVTHWAGTLQARFKDADEAALQSAGAVALAGRVMAIRHHGKTCFAHLRDQSGQIQLYARADVLGDAYAAFIDLDVGDFIGVTGELFRTRTGELTVAVKQFEFLAKSLRPLPEKWHGLKDVETRYRQRYVDLIVNPAGRARPSCSRAASSRRCAPSSTRAASSRSRRR